MASRGRRLERQWNTRFPANTGMLAPRKTSLIVTLLLALATSTIAVVLIVRRHVENTSLRRCAMQDREAVLDAVGRVRGIDPDRTLQVLVEVIRRNHAGPHPELATAAIQKLRALRLRDVSLIRMLRQVVEADLPGSMGWLGLTRHSECEELRRAALVSLDALEPAETSASWPDSRGRE